MFRPTIYGRKIMKKNKEHVLVTGGAGFIGSHLVDVLLSKNYYVTVYDNLSSKFEKNRLEHIFSNKNFNFKFGDILDLSNLSLAMKSVDKVFHLAANADIRGGIIDNNVDVQQNIIGTHNVCEACRLNKVKEIVFTSSAAVYGEPSIFPTPESYPLIQTSLYGASKASGESIIQAYSEYFGIKTTSFRFVSWIGERYSHGVIFDFVNLLKETPNKLEILGNGFQTKSYLHVDDGIRAMFLYLDSSSDKKGIVNIGHIEYLTVFELSDIVIDEMGLKEVTIVPQISKRGWVGDNPFVHLDISKIKNLGFVPEISIEEGIRRTVRYLLLNSG